MIEPAVLDALVEAGCSPQQIAAAVKASMRAEEEAKAERREKDRIRKREARAREKATNSMVASAESGGQSRNPADNPSSLEVPPRTPLPNPPSQKENPLRGQKKKVASRIPDDFQPDIEWAIAQGLSRQKAQMQAAKFRDYWTGARDGAKADWPATWRNWVRSSCERMGIAPPDAKPVTERWREFDRDKWAKLLEIVRGNREWISEAWGPMPGKPGCRVPPELLKPGDGDGWREFVNAA